MKHEQIILRRFDELTKKANIIEQTKYITGYGSSWAVDSEKYYEWATSVMGLIQNVFGKDSPHCINFKSSYDEFSGYYSRFQKSLGIFNAAKEDYEGGYLFKIKMLVSAEVLDSVLDQASELLEAGYKDPACIVAGIVLETALRELCKNNSISLGKLDKMNADLCKLGLYNVGMQKQITAWADRRNNAAHGNWSEYTKEDVNDMINGINRFLADHL